MSELIEFKSCAFLGDILPQGNEIVEAVAAPIWGGGAGAELPGASCKR